MVWLQSTQQEIKHINIKIFDMQISKKNKQNKQKQDY